MSSTATAPGHQAGEPPEGQRRPWLTVSLDWLRSQRALPAFVGAFVVWVATGVLAGHGAFATLTSGITIGTFLLFVGIGQMFVITTGNGGIDLSVPYVMTLSAYMTSSIMAGQNSNLIIGLLVAVLVGLVVGIVNVILIELISMPPIIATLAVGFVIQSATLKLAGNAAGSPSPALVSFVTGRIGPIPVMVILGIVVTVIFTLVLNRTTYGRSLRAMGQSLAAARLAGLKYRRLRMSAFIISSVASAVSGFLLAGYAGGPSLTMGNAYQLSSIAVVVLGGTLIIGGLSNVPGIWAAALLLTLLITLVNVAHLGAGMQDIVQGVLIVLVLAVGGTKRLVT